MDYTKFGVAVQRKFKKDDGTHETDFLIALRGEKLEQMLLLNIAKKEIKLQLLAELKVTKKMIKYTGM